MLRGKGYAVYFFAILSLAISISLNGCSKGAQTEDPGHFTLDSSRVGPSGEALDLQGRWKSNCGESSLIGLSHKIQLEVRGSGFVRRTWISGTGGCAPYDVELKEKGANSSPGSLGSEFQQINLKITAASMVALTRRGAALLNLARFCGASNWKVAAERNLTGLGGGLRCLAPLPSMEYTILKLENGKLYWGEPGDHSSQERRSGELNRDFYFVRTRASSDSID